MKELSQISRLAQKKCGPCEGGTLPLKGDELRKLSEELGGGWRVVDEHHLEKEYKFPDFRQAAEFTQKVGELAEYENHHPDIYLSWGKVKLTLWTHSINGLSENDFIFAAKVDEVPE